MAKGYLYDPDKADNTVPPGFSFEEWIDDHKLTVKKIAKKLKWHPEAVLNLIAGRLHITEEIAEELTEMMFKVATGQPDGLTMQEKPSMTRYWLAREESYQKAMRRGARVL